MSFPARIFLWIFSLSFLFLFTIPSPLFAQTYPSQNSVNQYIAPNVNANVDQNQHTFVQSLLIEVMASVACQLSGIDPLNPEKGCLGLDPITKKLGYVSSDGGALGFMGNMIAMTYTSPASTGQYVSYLSQNFGITKTAYAADNGIGFNGLTPLLGMWTVFRNISYLMFILLFIIVGFAIMLRFKIDPRTVMTIQNQIPKMIVTLLLITFSFAISGVLIDAMYVTCYVVFNIANQVEKGLPNNDGEKSIERIKSVQSTFQGDNPFGFGNNVIDIRNIGAGVSGEVRQQVVDMFSTSELEGKSRGYKVWDPRAWVLGATDAIRNGIMQVLGIFISLFAFLVIVCAMLWALFRIWFRLISAYISILMYVAFAPIMIAMGVLPNAKINFTYWLRRMISYLLVFPATIGVFLVARIFMDAFGKTPSDTYFIPPLIGNPNDISAWGYIIAFGIILMAPPLLDIIRDALQAPASKYTAPALSEGLKMGSAPASTATGFLWGRMTRKYDPKNGYHEEGLIRHFGTGTPWLRDELKDTWRGKYARFATRWIGGTEAAAKRGGGGH